VPLRLASAAALALLAFATAPRAHEAGRVVAVPDVPVREHAALQCSPGWPVWLKDFGTSRRGEGTADLAYAGRAASGERCFFLTEAGGSILFCRVAQPGDSGAVSIALEPVGFDAGSLEALAGYRKWNLQALALEPEPGRAAAVRSTLADTLGGVLVVAGSGMERGDPTGVLRVRFERPAAGAAWRVATEGEWIAGAAFWEPFVLPTGSLTGIGRAPNFTYLGLSRLLPRGELNVLGTMIFVYDHERERVAQVVTRKIEVNSIGGMHALADDFLVLVDRDRLALAVLRWDAETPGSVVACDRFPLDLPAPGGFRYAIPALEGVTIDERGDIWCVVGPVRQSYRPLEAAAPETLRVYMEAEIPILYRFPGERVWRETGLADLWRAEER